MLLTYKRGHYF